MATLRGLVKKLGGRGTDRYLQEIGVTRPGGGKADERWIRDTLKPRSDRKNAAKARQTARANEAYINAKIRNVDTRKVKPIKEGQGGITSGAEPKVVLKTGSKIGRGPLGGDKYVGELDTRGAPVKRDLTKDALRKLIAGSGLSPSSDWKMAAFGEWMGQGQFGSDVFGTWLRKWRRVNVKLGALFFDDWAATELEIAQEIAFQTQSAQSILQIQSRNPLAVLDPHAREAIKRKIQRGDPKDPEHYPSFAARYCTIASGGTVWWRNVYAASLNYPVGGQ